MIGGVESTRGGTSWEHWLALVCVSTPESVWAGVCAPQRAPEGTSNHRISYVVIVTLSHFCTFVNFLY